MCDCGITNPVFPLPGRSPSLPKQEKSVVTYEVRLFWTQNLKYCDNPKRHIFGSCLRCKGLRIATGAVDPRDFAIPLLDNDPFLPPQKRYSPTF